jgi:hypothetical protein
MNANDEAIVPTKERPSNDDALEQAAPNEPIFPLIASDPEAPATVRHWVELRRKRAMAIDDVEKRRALLRKASRAEQISWAMEDWRLGRTDEAPVASVSVSYSGHEQSEEARHADDRVSALLRSARRIDNSVAEMAEIAALLDDLGLREDGFDLRFAVEMLRELSERVRPKRPSYAAEPKLPGVV